MAAASHHPRILSPKYWQTGNVKPLTANGSLSFAVKWPNLDLKVSNDNQNARKDSLISHGRLAFCTATKILLALISRAAGGKATDTTSRKSAIEEKMFWRVTISRSKFLHD